MFASIIIISFSVLLFLYWFRYSCLLILSTKTARDYTADVAKANQLEFPRIQVRLRGELADAGLDTLIQSLGRDYELLTGLLEHAAQFQVSGVSIEQRMLMLDYQVMSLWFSLARRLSQDTAARRALIEMTDIVAHFANAMGERSAAAAKA